MASDAPPGLIRWLPAVVALIALVVAATVAIRWVVAPAGGADLILVEVRGEVSIGEDGERQEAAAGRRIRADEQLSTGASSSAILAAGPDIQLRLAPDTSLRVDRVDAESLVVELDEGRVRAEVERGSRALRVGSQGRAIETRDGAVVVASIDGVFAVDVERGSATTSGIDGVRRLRAGERVTALPDGSSALGPIPDDVVLSVAWPDERRTRASQVRVSGVTAVGSRVVISAGADPITVRPDARGRFEAMVAVPEGAAPVTVQAIDPFGRVVEDQVVFEVDRTPPTLRGGRVEEPP